MGNKEKSIVVVQLSGGNDYLNTVVPYGDDEYYDFRRTVHIEQEKVLPIDKVYGFSPHMAPIKRLYDQGKVAIINGIGYDNPTGLIFGRWIYGIQPNLMKLVLKGG